MGKRRAERSLYLIWVVPRNVFFYSGGAKLSFPPLGTMAMNEYISYKKIRKVSDMPISSSERLS